MSKALRLLDSKLGKVNKRNIEL